MKVAEESVDAAATITVNVVVVTSRPSSAVTTTVTVLLPVVSPVSPETTDVAPAASVTTTVTDVVPKGLLIVSASTAATPSTVKVAEESVDAAVATLLNDTPDKRITKSRIIGFFDLKILFMNKTLHSETPVRL